MPQNDFLRLKNEFLKEIKYFEKNKENKVELNSLLVKYR